MSETLTREKLLELLKRLGEPMRGDEESNHWDADQALLDFINDQEVRTAYEAIRRWYA